MYDVVGMSQILVGWLMGLMHKSGIDLRIKAKEPILAMCLLSLHDPDSTTLF